MRGLENENKTNRAVVIMLAIYSIVLIVSAINPYDRGDWFLEVLLPILLIIGLAFTYRYFKFSVTSYVLILILIIMQTYGAHYSYTTTPIDGFMNNLFHFKRDNLDRVVHFTFGLLMVYPVREMIERSVKVKRPWSSIFSLAIILAMACFYELIEMWVATIIAPDLGPLFLGTQGDVWDTQRDMEMALYGSVITICFTYVFGMISNRYSTKSRRINFYGSSHSA